MVDWTLVGIWVVAAAVLLNACIAWLAYLHARTVSGQRNPVVIGRPKGSDVFMTHPLVTQDPHERSRTVWIRIFNQSSVPQSFIVDADDSAVLAPKMEGVQPFFRHQVIDLPPNDGGNVSLVVSHVYGEWPDDIDPSTGETRTPYRLRLVGETKRGRRKSWEGELQLQDPLWEPPAD